MVARQAPLFMELSRQESWSRGFPGDSVVKSMPANAGPTGLILIQEGPRCHRTIKPRCHIYCAYALKPESHNY